MSRRGQHGVEKNFARRLERIERRFDVSVKDVKAAGKEDVTEDSRGTEVSEAWRASSSC